MRLLATRQRRTRATAVPPAEVGELAEQGKKLIIVAKDFDDRYVPKGYTKLVLTTPVDQFIGLVPAVTVIHLDEHNLSDYDIDNALDELSALYDEIEDANDVLGDDNRINCGGADLAVTVRRNYQTVCTNNALSGQDTHEPSEAEYRQSETGRLCLDHQYVEKRMRAIAALALGVGVDEIKERVLGDVLGFKEYEDEEQITEDELRQITTAEHTTAEPRKAKHRRCTGASYFYLKPELRDRQDGWDYDLRTMKKKRTNIKGDALRKIGDLEAEIGQYQRERSPGEITPHDANKTRAVINMRYGSSLDINPITEQASKE